ETAEASWSAVGAISEMSEASTAKPPANRGRDFPAGAGVCETVGGPEGAGGTIRSVALRVMGAEAAHSSQVPIASSRGSPPGDDNPSCKGWQILAVQESVGFSGRAGNRVRLAFPPKVT